jgi:hypothetical protein
MPGPRKYEWLVFCRWDSCLYGTGAVQWEPFGREGGRVCPRLHFERVLDQAPALEQLPQFLSGKDRCQYWGIMYSEANLLNLLYERLGW